MSGAAHPRLCTATNADSARERPSEANLGGTTAAAAGEAALLSETMRKLSYDFPSRVFCHDEAHEVCRLAAARTFREARFVGKTGST
jgi:hypothetical protein